MQGATLLKTHTFMGTGLSRARILLMCGIATLPVASVQAQEEATSTADNARWYQFDVLAFRQKSQSSEVERLPKPSPHILPLDSVTLYTESQLTIPAALLPVPGQPVSTPVVTEEWVNDSATIAVPQDNLTQLDTVSPQNSTEVVEQTPSAQEDTPAAPLTDRKPDLERDAFVQLPSQLSTLAKASHSLRRSRDYRVLWEGSWRMPLIRDAEPVSIRIVGGHESGSSHEIEGVLQLSLKRFLHAQTQLWVNELNPVRPLEQLLAGAPVLSDTVQPYNPVGHNLPGPVQPQQIQFRWPKELDYSASMPLHSSKRLSFGKLIYLDNPEAGLLIRVSPWERPEPVEIQTVAGQASTQS